MDTIRHNRPLAIVALAVIVLLSLVLGTLRSAASLGRKTERAYVRESGEYGSAKNDLTKLVELSAELNVISAAAGTGELTAEIEALRKGLASPVGQGDAALALYTAASAAYGRITGSKDVPEEFRNSATLYFYDIQSTWTRLKGNEDYRRAAEKYNGAIRSFPLSLLGKTPAAEY